MSVTAPTPDMDGEPVTFISDRIMVLNATGLPAERLQAHNELAGLDAALAALIEGIDAKGFDRPEDMAAVLRALGRPDLAANWEEEPEEALENPCSNCGEGDAQYGMAGMCASCTHNALRSGWEPGDGA